MNIIIREYLDTDKGNVLSLWETLLSPNAYHRDPDFNLNMKVQHDDNLLLVAEADSRFAGTAMAGYDGHRGWIYSVAVMPELQRCGIGRELVKELVVRLKSAGCRKINLQVEHDNALVVDFYKKLGFDVEDHISMGLII